MLFDHALILGCGYTGLELARRLVERGTTVEGTRLGTDGPGLPGLAIRPLDLRSPAPGLELATAPGTVVYYLVSTLHRELDPVARPHLGPLEAVLAALERSSVACLIYLSSTSVYGDRGGALVDELTPTSPDSPWGQMRVDLEQRVWRWGRDRGVPACVVRAPEIYGPGRGPIARLRGGGVLHYPERYSNRIHVVDLAEILAELGERREPELLLASDDEPAPSGEVYALAARLLGRGELPRGEQMPSADPNLLSLQRDSKRCANARLRAWLGRPLRYPTFREGLPSTL